MDIEADKREAVVFAASLVEQVNREDVANMVQVQRGMLQRFEKTNEMLINFNQLSFSRYEASVKEFQGHTHLLYDMKKDLDSIFKRIRVLKQRLSKSYPDAFAAACSGAITEEDDDDDLDVPTQPTTTTTTPPTTTSTATTTAKSSSSSSSSRKRSEGDGSASKTRVAQPAQKVKSSSARSKGGATGQTGQSTARKTSRPRPEGKEVTGVRPPAPQASNQSKAKPQ